MVLLNQAPTSLILGPESYVIVQIPMIGMYHDERKQVAHFAIARFKLSI